MQISFKNETQGKSFRGNNFEILENTTTGYNTLTFIKANDTDIVAGDKISIEIDTVKKYFYVFRTEKQSKNILGVECKGVGAFLDEPFILEEEVLEPCKTLGELVSYYYGKYGINIEYRGVDFSFGESYKRVGTPLDTLKTLANIAGCELYEDSENEKIVIEPFTGIDDVNVIEVKPFEVVDFLPDSRVTDLAKIGAVNIGTNSKELTTAPKCYVDLNSCSGYGLVSITPKGSLIEAYNFKYIREGVIKQIEVHSINKFDQKITTKYPIKEILKITINGIEQTTLDFIEDTVILPLESVGRVYIEYLAYCYEAQMNSIDELGVEGFYGNIIYGKESYQLNKNIDIKKYCNKEDSIDGEITYNTKDCYPYRLRLSNTSLNRYIKIKAFSLMEEEDINISISAITKSGDNVSLTSTFTKRDILYREKRFPLWLETPYNGYSYYIDFDFTPKQINLVRKNLLGDDVPFLVENNRIYLNYSEMVVITFTVYGVAGEIKATAKVTEDVELSIYLNSKLCYKGTLIYDPTALENIDRALDLPSETGLALDDFAGTNIKLNDEDYLIGDDGLVDLDDNLDMQNIQFPETDPCKTLDIGFK